MQCDVRSCTICISNKFEYLKKGERYKNSNEKIIVGNSKRSLQCNQQNGEQDETEKKNNFLHAIKMYYVYTKY